jgi:hypothetical protein
VHFAMTASENRNLLLIRCHLSCLRNHTKAQISSPHWELQPEMLLGVPTVQYPVSHAQLF